MTRGQSAAPKAGKVGAALRLARRDIPFVFVAAAVFALDQLTKSLVRNNLALGESWPSDDWLVKIVHGTNSGAAFGILQGQGAFLTVTAFIAIGAIIFYYAFPPFEHGLLRLALGLQLGGALGNLSDRLRFGEVTDLISFPHYPSFNVADSSIVVGLGVIVVFFLLFDRRKPDTGPPDSSLELQDGRQVASTPDESHS